MRTFFWITGILALAVALLVVNEPFFWDTIQLGARHADWFYTQPFGTLLLPDEMDSGHIPAFGWYLAGCWRLFGQNLMVSHLAMVPWIWLVLWQAYRLAMSVVNGFTKPISIHLATEALGHGEKEGTAVDISFGYVAALILVLDATLVAQLSLISPDIVLVGAFLLGINSIRQQQRRWLALAILLLGLISLRGMMVAVGLFLWQCYQLFAVEDVQHKPTKFWQTLLPYLPAGILALAYLGYHYLVKGWVGTHDDSPWAASFASTGVTGWLKQVAVVVWRMLDFGRIFLFLALVLSWWRSGWAWNKEIKTALALLFIMGGILALPAIISPGLAQHRYLLPVYLGAAYLLLLILKQVGSWKWRNGIITIVLLGQLSGHFWIYPTGVAQGWDASLAHKPYFEAKEAGFNFLAQQAIPLNQVGTAFPEIGSQHLRLLNGDTAGMVPVDLAQQSYVWYSNVMNDFSEQEVLTLQREWAEVFSFEKRGVFLKIYRECSNLCVSRRDAEPAEVFQGLAIN